MQVMCTRDPLEVFVEASSVCYDAVAHTIGPGGTNTAIVNKRGYLDIINDGYSILKPLTSTDSAVASALETLKLSSFETNRKAGDGTTSTTILTHELLTGAVQYLHDNPSITKVQLRSILEEAKEDYIETLHESYSREVNDEDYEAIAKVSLGSSKYASIIADSYRFLPKGLKPAAVRADIVNVVKEEINGVSIDKAEIIVPADTFEKGPKEYENLDVYVIYDKLDRWNLIQPIIEQIVRLGNKSIIFYNELSYDIMNNMQLQIIKGYADIIPIRLGALGSKMRSVMEEIAKYTGATLIDGIDVKLPKAMNKLNVGHLDYAIMSDTMLAIRNDSFTKLDSIKLPTRSVILRVGGNNTTEMEENYRRIEDAINSLGNAIETGISVGAGITYQRIKEASLHYKTTPDFIKNAMESIYNKVVKNLTGKDNINKETDGLLKSENGEFNLVDDLKIFDATKVVEQVIINSFSLVSQIITTESMIIENVR